MIASSSSIRFARASRTVSTRKPANSSNRKGENGLALGNVIGSNIFNVLMVLAASAAVHPIEVTSFSVIDTVCLIVASVVTWVLCRSKLRISRGEGLAMLAMYAGYLVYICIR